MVQRRIQETKDQIASSGCRGGSGRSASSQVSNRRSMARVAEIRSLR